MSDTFTVDFDGTRAIARFDAMPGRVRDALLAKVEVLRQKLEAKIKGKLTGQVLNRRSGALFRSIFSERIDQGNAIYGRAASSGDVKYAAIHEFGGKTPAHDIIPTKAKALAFIVGGKMQFAKIVHHPGSVMPERSFMRSSLSDMRDEIVSGLKSAVLQSAARQ